MGTRLIVVAMFGAACSADFDHQTGSSANAVSSAAQLPPELAETLTVKKYRPDEIARMTPPGPNPWLSIPPAGATVDWNYWRTRMAMERPVTAALRAPAAKQMRYQGGPSRHAMVVRGLGVGANLNASIDVSGTATLPDLVPLDAGPEDQGSIPLATETGISGKGRVQVSSFIGDGPFGSAGAGSGDFDAYVLRGVREGQLIDITVRTPLPFDVLDPFVTIWDSAGGLVAFNDDGIPGTFDSALQVDAPADGDYFIIIGAFGNPAPADPFDSSTGNGNVFNEGEYVATIGLDAFDEFKALLVLPAGIALDANFGPLPALLEFSDFNRLRIGSRGNASFILPEVSPLRSDSQVAAHTVVDRTGLYFLRGRIFEAGDYTVQLRAFLPTLATGSRRDVQTIFVDFDGATIDTGALFLGQPPGQTISTLSPLVDFLPRWGLDASDEDAVIDAIMASVRETLVDDIREDGFNRRFKIRLLNSRDHADPFGEPNVSRLIVGGTIPEFGIGTIGIAESIDVGNFETEETAVILLDLLSEVAGNPNSLNSFALAPGASIIDLVGQGVGNITAHEAGHYLGNFHTEQFETPPNIMDQGGNLANTVGVGADFTFGTDDDVDVDFGIDLFVPSEGFTGEEDTLNTIAFGATRGWRLFFHRH